MAVGEWIDNSRSRQRQIRMPINPMDKATVVSIYPEEVIETKPTLQPNTFVVPGGTIDEPGILVIGTCCWWKNTDLDHPPLEMIQPSVLVADSIVKDWMNGLLGCEIGVAQPGLFFIPGEHNQLEILAQCEEQLRTANERQRRWYQALVSMADTMWSRTNGNPLAISDGMRLAAQELGMKDKPWLADYNTMEMVACTACGQMRNGAFPVCPNCRTIIDKAAYEAAGLSQLSV
jgi:hypothetical protein